MTAYERTALPLLAEKTGRNGIRWCTDLGPEYTQTETSEENISKYTLLDE